MVLKTGPGHGPEEDPLVGLERELARFRPAKVPGLSLPPNSGGALGYVAYDCVKYFEPRTRRDLADPLQLPESLFMMCDTIVAFDHFFQTIQVVSHLHVDPATPATSAALQPAYEAASRAIADVVATLRGPDDVPLPPQPPITKGRAYKSNIGRAGYEQHVARLQEHIRRGDIIQAVPSQRIARPTNLHPFNVYRHLRTVNPSPYLFYMDCGGDFQLVGASPELLVKADAGRIITHPIAGTVRRGRSHAEDDALARQLRESPKDRAEHVMLVDLARNDVNRVCDPLSTTVDRLMTVERFSHVMHLVSQVSGVLRPGMTRFDAFRSIFPAGTVSGAPKVRAMELIAELEGEKRGVYAGAVGYWGYDPDSMDTCIALRTMTLKDGVAYLQAGIVSPFRRAPPHFRRVSTPPFSRTAQLIRWWAGGGIVFDSDPYDEWMETMNKLAANIHCITSAEERFGEDSTCVSDLAAGLQDSPLAHGPPPQEVRVEE